MKLTNGLQLSETLVFNIEEAMTFWPPEVHLLDRQAHKKMKS